MPRSEEKTPNALAIIRRVGTESAIVKFGAGAEMSSALTRLVLRNVRMAFISRKEENIVLNADGNSQATEQREGAEPVMKFVRVAMKPPTVVAPAADWDVRVNWEANSKKWEGGLNGRTQRKKPSQPSFVWGEVPYDEWRKYYAKDKAGRYRGTEAPAENCILTPADEIKWRSEKPNCATDQSSQKDDLSSHFEQVKRSATLPEHQKVDPLSSIQTEQDPGVPTRKEEAIFIEDDGHTASQIVEVPKSGFASSTSPTSSIFPDLPTSPTASVSRRELEGL